MNISHDLSDEVGGECGELPVLMIIDLCTTPTPTLFFLLFLLMRPLANL